MKDLYIKQIEEADFIVSNESPVLKPFGITFVVADPSLLTPENTHDNRWRMFFHTHFGVYQAESDDGIRFTEPVKIVPNAMRPNINYIDGKYYLYFEKTRPVFFNALNLINLAQWKSEIYMMKSDDLKRWTKPQKVIAQTKEYEKFEHGISISNPFLLQDNGINRLYYSCGLTFIKDCGFCEPTYISYAESKSLTIGFKSADKPILSPNKSIEYINLCCGCLKVYRLKDGYIGIQNGIFEKDGISHSAIVMLKSYDGLNFSFSKMLLEPQIHNGNDWMKQFVYASHLVKTGNTLRLYFNARDTSNMLKGRECIGFAECRL